MNIDDISPSANVIFKVMLIDDQPIVGEGIRRMLEHDENIEYHYCQNPAEAMGEIERIQPTIILQDLIMPDIDGMTMVRFFREQPLTKEIPVIVLSSKEDAEIKAEAFAAGATDYLVKMPHEFELLARIRHHSKAYLDAMAVHETLAKLQQTQGQLIQSEKMASIGQLAAGVAHEINNPIGFIKSNMGTLQEYMEKLIDMVELYQLMEPSADIDQDILKKINDTREILDFEFLKEDSVELMNESSEGLNRVKKIVQDLKDYSHIDDENWQLTDIHKGIESTLSLMAHQLGNSIKIDKQFGELPQVACLAASINQIFSSILTNAIQSIDGQGTITIRTGTGSKPEQDLPITEECVWIEVTDDGKGIEPDNISKIFDPFFTTLPVGSGQGLGLSTSHSIAHKHNGEILVQSQPDAGASFTIYLPSKQEQSD